MRRAVLGLVVAWVLVFSAHSASAFPGLKYGVDGAVTIPLSSWADASGIGIGALGVIEFTAIPLFDITGRIGYIHGLEKNNVSIKHIPVMAGVKYILLPGVNLYLAGEIGMVFSKATADFMGLSGSSDWESEIGISIGAGAALGPLDVRGALFSPDVGEIGDMIGLLATVGYRF